MNPSTAGTAEAFAKPCGVFEHLDFLDRAGEHRNRNHLGNLLASINFYRFCAQVGHHDLYLAAIARIYDPGNSGDTLRCHGGTVADEKPEWNSGLRMTCFDGDSGADPNGLMRFKQYGFEREDVVAEVFAWMRHNGQSGTGFEKLHAQHLLMVTARRSWGCGFGVH